MRAGVEVLNNLVCEIMKCNLVFRIERSLRGWAGFGGLGEDLDSLLGVIFWICVLVFLCIGFFNFVVFLWFRISFKSK